MTKWRYDDGSVEGERLSYLVDKDRCTIYVLMLADHQNNDLITTKFEDWIATYLMNSLSHELLQQISGRYICLHYAHEYSLKNWDPHSTL